MSTIPVQAAQPSWGSQFATGLAQNLDPSAITGIMAGMNSGTDYGTALANQSQQNKATPDEQQLRQQALQQMLQKQREEDALKPLVGDK